MSEDVGQVSSVLWEATEVEASLDRLADAIVRDIPEGQPLYLIGIQQKGVLVAEHLSRRLKARGVTLIQGTLDIGMHRDDLHHHPAPSLNPTSLSVTVDHHHVLIVDDVLHSGRTTRAALSALTDFGAASCIRLAVLVDRGHRKLPIQPDFTGLRADVEEGERVLVKYLEGQDALEVYLEKA